MHSRLSKIKQLLEMDVLEAAEGTASSSAQAAGNDAVAVVCELCGSLPPASTTINEKLLRSDPLG